jgi:hypothetical protein
LSILTFALSMVLVTGRVGSQAPDKHESGDRPEIDPRTMQMVLATLNNQKQDLDKQQLRLSALQRQYVTDADALRRRFGLTLKDFSRVTDETYASFPEFASQRPKASRIKIKIDALQRECSEITFVTDKPEANADAIERLEGAVQALEPAGKELTSISSPLVGNGTGLYFSSETVHTTTTYGIRVARGVSLVASDYRYVSGRIASMATTKADIQVFIDHAPELVSVLHRKNVPEPYVTASIYYLEFYARMGQHAPAQEQPLNWQTVSGDVNTAHLVLIDSVPAKAKVWIDGCPLPDSTPTLVGPILVPHGPHRIRWSKDPDGANPQGYITVESTETVADVDPNTFSKTLTPKPKPAPKKN